MRLFSTFKFDENLVVFFFENYDFFYFAVGLEQVVKREHIDFDFLVVNCHQHDPRFLVQIQWQFIHQTQIQLLLPNTKRSHQMLLHNILNFLQRREFQINT